MGTRKYDEKLGRKNIESGIEMYILMVRRDEDNGFFYFYYGRWRWIAKSGGLQVADLTPRFIVSKLLARIYRRRINEK